MTSSCIQIYTDGSSLGNPGPGGWGVVFTSSKQGIGSGDKDGREKVIKELGGFDKNTTNNKMELKAVIEALKYANKNYPKDKITIFADSNYVLSGITSWIHNWEKNNWRTVNKKAVLNKELWQELINEVRNFKGELSWTKVKGHSGHIYNDKADEIATTYASKQK